MREEDACAVWDAEGTWTSRSRRSRSPTTARRMLAICSSHGDRCSSAPRCSTWSSGSRAELRPESGASFRSGARTVVDGCGSFLEEAAVAPAPHRDDLADDRLGDLLRSFGAEVEAGRAVD